MFATNDENASIGIRGKVATPKAIRGFGRDLTQEYKNQASPSKSLVVNNQQEKELERLKRENEKLKLQLEEEPRRIEEAVTRQLLKTKGPLIRSLQHKSIQLKDSQEEVSRLQLQLETLSQETSKQNEKEMTNYLLRTRPNSIRQLMRTKYQF